MAITGRLLGAVTAASLAIGLVSAAPASAETRLFDFDSTPREVITAVKVANGDSRLRLTIKVRPVRRIDNWSWYLDVNAKSRAQYSDDFYVTKQTGYKPIIQKFWGSSYTVKCDGVRTGLLKGERGAWVSVPQRCLTDKYGDEVSRVRVWSEAAWGSTADRAPGTLSTARYTAWVARD